MLGTIPTACPLCNAPVPIPTGRTHTDGGTTYTQYECGVCLVQFWWPMKSPGAEWYRRHEKYEARNVDPVWSPTRNHQRTLSFLADHRGLVLDVGCGIGNFLSEAKSRGWKCAGIDFDP